MSSISINKSIASAVLALGVAFSGQALAEDATSTPMDAKGMPTKTEATKVDNTDFATQIDNTLSRFNSEQPRAKEILGEAKGVLVCPSITKAGLGVGVAGGSCVLRIGDANVANYRYAAVKAGFIVGAESYSMIMTFNTEAALGKFRSSKRKWEIGADVAVAIGEKGKTGSLDTTNIRSAIVAFIFDSKGVMGDASIAGGNFKRIEHK